MGPVAQIENGPSIYTTRPSSICTICHGPRVDNRVGDIPFCLRTECDDVDGVDNRFAAPASASCLAPDHYFDTNSGLESAASVYLARVRIGGMACAPNRRGVAFGRV